MITKNINGAKKFSLKYWTASSEDEAVFMINRVPSLKEVMEHKYILIVTNDEDVYKKSIPLTKYRKVGLIYQRELGVDDLLYVSRQLNAI
jgi:hypothetical protein